MTIDVTEKDGSKLIRLCDTIGIDQAAELRQHLIEAFASSQSVEVDLSAAVRLDATAIQLLWAAQRHASSHQVVFLCAGPMSKELETSLIQAGISPFWCHAPEPGVARGSDDHQH